jgi:hypothetical protein
MSVVRMVQVAIDQIVNVIPVRHRLMPAIRPMHVTFDVSFRAMSASVGMFLIDFDDVFGKSVPFHVPKVTAFEVIGVPMMFHRQMSATGTVSVLFLFFSKSGHNILLSLSPSSARMRMQGFSRADYCNLFANNGPSIPPQVGC